MLEYLLKSGVCLAVFYGFYKLLLEQESMHTFKRYYLLASIALSFVIPFITFTTYITAPLQHVPSFYSEASITHARIEAEPINYTPMMLWVLYGLGALLFSIKFFKNLLQLLKKIKDNTKVKIGRFTHVLLQDLMVPHTFFNYIFLNKQKFETQLIPKEVLLHEETHAKQKHSLDVLFIEVLHILFWFNPFIYLLKLSIKLNHEFLADQAVINKGVKPSTYQQILLAFSSNASEPSLAHAINYSSIKKRFTVMKTHTSKQAFWLRSFIVFPLLALLIYSFSEKKVIENPQVYQLVTGDIKVHIAKDRTVTIGNETIHFNALSDKLVEMTKNEKMKPLVSIEIEGHVDTAYLEDIISEVKKSSLFISNIRATSISFDETNGQYGLINDYFKGPLMAEFIVLKDKEGKVMKGSTGPQIVGDSVKLSNSDEDYDLITIKLPKNRGRPLNSNDLGKLDEFVKETFYDKTQQKATSEDHISISINEKGELLVNNAMVDIHDLKKLLNDLTKDLTSEQKENTTVNIRSHAAPTARINEVKAILRDSKLLKIGVLNINVSERQQKASPEEIQEYNALAKKFSSNPKGIFKAKDIRRIIVLYNAMSEDQRKRSETFPEFSPPPPLPEHASSEEKVRYDKAYANYKELTKDLKK